ncbi:MAG: IS21 family transposase [Stenotrophobium sp.]
MYQYRQVLVRMRQGDSDRDMDRAGLMGRKKLATVRELAARHGWLDPEQPLPDDTVLAGVFARSATTPVSCVSSVEPFREQVTAWFNEQIQGTTILNALRRNHGYQGSYSAVARFLQQLDAEQPPIAKSRLEFSPGEAVQVDFGMGPTITDVHSGEVFKTWVFVMTLCWSRHQYAELIRDQSSATWLACHRRAFEWFNGVPTKVTIDNAKCAITRACARDPEVQRSYAECAEGYGFKIDACPPRDPQKKGIVEAGVKYVKRAFFPLREFRSLVDANRQLQEWVLGEAGNRIHGTTKEKPLSRFAQTERGLLQPLPDVPPVLASWTKVKVHRDAHVQFDYCLYSAPFRLVGQSLWLKATDTLVGLYREHELVAVHPRKTKSGDRSTLPDHMPPEALAWRLHDTQWCLRQAEQVGPQCLTLIRALFADRVLENMRAVQGVLGLSKTYGAPRLEAACARALSFDSPRYRTVKTILAKGLDQTDPDLAAPPVGDTYTQGGRFYRDTQTLLH